MGDFALDEDRKSCNQIIRVALNDYLSELRASKNKTAFRLYLSLFEDLTGLPRKRRSFEEFLAEFSFAKPVRQYRGLGPIACGALSGDPDLLRALSDAKASVHTNAPGMPETFNMPDFTPLHLALWFRSHDLRVVGTLLELRADPNWSSINIGPAVGASHSAEAVELLVRYGAELNFPGKLLHQFAPLHIQAGKGVPCDVVAKMLELRADPRGGRGGLGSCSPLCQVAFSGDSDNDLRSAQLLLESQADPNQHCRPTGVARSFELMARAYSRCCWGEPSILIRAHCDVSTTPLGFCALFANEGLLIYLLCSRADPDVRNNRGLRPIDLATSERIRAILQNPAPHMYQLEHDAEIITERV